jgi:hypothetical protein
MKIAPGSGDPGDVEYELIETMDTHYPGNRVEGAFDGGSLITNRRACG